MPGSEVPYPPRPRELPTTLAGVRTYPHPGGYFTHDWNVVAHDLGWQARDAAQARRAGERFGERLRAACARAGDGAGVMRTYREAADAAA